MTATQPWPDPHVVMNKALESVPAVRDNPKERRAHGGGIDREVDQVAGIAGLVGTRSICRAIWLPGPVLCKVPRACAPL